MCTDSFGWHKNATPDIFSFIFPRFACLADSLFFYSFIFASLHHMCVCLYHFNALLFFRNELKKKYHQNYNMYFAIIKIYTYLSYACVSDTSAKKKVLARDKQLQQQNKKRECRNNHYFFGGINRNYTHVMYQIFIKIH